MSPPRTSHFGLTRARCLARQQRLRQRLAEGGLDAAVLLDPRHVHYFTGYWTRSAFRTGLLIEARGHTVLALPFENDLSATEIAADEILTYPGVLHGTLIDDSFAGLVKSLAEGIRSETVGSDQAIADRKSLDLGPTLRELRRTKDPDELTLIRRGILGCEAAYAAARELILAGVSEVEVYARTLAAAIEAVGEPIGEFGNDFQSGTPGGPPRQRAMEAGELMPLDLSVVVRGHGSDLCRTFAVGRSPSDAQREAHARVLEVLETIEALARPGASCRNLFNHASQMLDGYRGWSFFHHLGHGIGLWPHEAPRLNPHWDDVLQEGDVFTLEPGLYGEELRGGVRIEHDYVVTATGAQRLDSFPTDL